VFEQAAAALGEVMRLIPQCEPRAEPRVEVYCRVLERFVRVAGDVDVGGSTAAVESAFEASFDTQDLTVFRELLPRADRLAYEVLDGLMWMRAFAEGGRADALPERAELQIIDELLFPICCILSDENSRIVSSARRRRRTSTLGCSDHRVESSR